MINIRCPTNQMGKSALIHEDYEKPTSNRNQCVIIAVWEKV